MYTFKYPPIAVHKEPASLPTRTMSGEHRLFKMKNRFNNNILHIIEFEIPKVPKKTVMTENNSDV